MNDKNSDELVKVNELEVPNADLHTNSSKMTKGNSSALQRGRKVVIFVHEANLTMVRLPDPADPNSKAISTILTEDCGATYFKLYVTDTGIVVFAQDDSHTLFVIQVNDESTLVVSFDLMFKIDHVLIGTAIGSNTPFMVGGIWKEELVFFSISLVTDEGKVSVKLPDTRVTLDDYKNIDVISLLFICLAGKTYDAAIICPTNEDNNRTDNILMLFDTDEEGGMVYDTIDMDTEPSFEGLKKYFKLE